MEPLPNEPDTAQIARDVLTGATQDLGLKAQDMASPVREAAGDYAQAIGDVLGAVDQLADDLAELDAKADLLPAQGVRRLRRESVEEAQRVYMEADRRAGRALDAIHDALTDAALPKAPAVEREALARGELDMALSGPGAMVEKVADIAAHGSREVVATLLSSYGRTALKARGMNGAELDEALQTARTLAAHAGLDYGLEPGEILASMALKKLPRLAAARGASGAHALFRLRQAGGARL
jgi:hypothetical protein